MSVNTDESNKNTDIYFPPDRILSVEDLAEIIFSDSITNQVLNSKPPRLSLFLGAGASVSSNIIAGGKMIKHFVETIFARERKHRKNVEELKAIEDEEIEILLSPKSNEDALNKIFDKKKAFLRKLLEHKVNEYENKEVESDYSFFFRQCYRKEIDRRDYIRSIIEPAEISWGYIQLANLIERGIFRNILTTNFDDLVYQTCTSFTNIRPIVFSYGNLASEITFSSIRPQIFKLHGDFLYSKLKNTDIEINQTITSNNDDDPNMHRAFEQGLQNHQGIVVIGYAGNDNSIMDVFKKIPETHYLLWCIVTNKNDEDKPLTWDHLEKTYGKKLRKLLEARDGFIVKTNGFDEIMSKICEIADIGYDNIISSVIKRTTTLRNKLYNVKREPIKFLSRTETEEKERFKVFKKEIDKVFLATSYFFLGYDYYLQNLYEEAENEYKKSIDKYKKFADVHFNYGNLLAKDDKRHLEAIEKYREAIKLSPLDAYAYNRLGNLLTIYPFHKEEAKVLIEKAIKLKPDFEFAYYNLGNWYRQWGTSEKAKESFETALKISRDFVNPLISLIAVNKILNNKKDIPRLEERIRALLQKDDLYNWACFSSVIEDRNTAVEYLKAAIKKDPKIRSAARNDLNFEFIINDPRFEGIVSE